jgi:hypothetical protein
MYDFIDQRVTALDRGGQFLIWSMRSWVLARETKRCPPNVIGPAFAKWGMISALPHFHAAMIILCKEGLETLHFSPIKCLHISDDEAMLLSLFRLLRDDQPDRIKSTTALLVTESYAAPLLAALTAVSIRLADTNLIPEAPAHTYSPVRAGEK